MALAARSTGVPILVQLMDVEFKHSRRAVRGARECRLHREFELLRRGNIARRTVSIQWLSTRLSHRKIQNPNNATERHLYQPCSSEGAEIVA